LGAAEQRWGLAGVTAELAGQSGLMLITTAAALPRGHPLAQRGLDDDVAGLLLADPWSGLAHVTMGRWLTAALAGRLVGRCRALEAQAALAAFTAQPSSPAAAWLDWVGFRPHSRFPPGLVPFWRLTHRYRLDLDATLPSVLADQPRRPTVRWWLGPKAAPATRA
jgi:hypothetical protein